MSFVEYYPGNSLFHRLDPRAKIVTLVLLTTVIFLVTNFIVICGLFLIIVTFWLLSGLPNKTLIAYLKFMLPLFALLTLIQGFFYGGPTALVEPVIPEGVPLIGGKGRLSLEGLLFGVLLSFRLLTLICLMPLTTMTTPLHKLTLGMVKMGLNYKIAYIITTTLNLIPSLQAELQVIIDAQRLRAFRVFEEGTVWEKIKSYPALVTPLVIGAMRRAQTMGVAMDARAFGAQKTRTYIENIVMDSGSWAFIAAMVVLSVACVALNYMLKGFGL